MAERKPLVFACAGCSFAGKLAYDLAKEIDRRGDAEMSCLAGVGAKHPSFLRKLEGREAWIIDGCPIECARGVFVQIERIAERHIKLHDRGFKKNAEPTEGVDVSRLAEQVVRQRHPEPEPEPEAEPAPGPCDQSRLSASGAGLSNRVDTGAVSRCNLRR